MFNLWMCIKQIKLSDNLVIRKDQYPIMCFGAILLLQLAEKHLETLWPACKQKRKQSQKVHIKSTSKIIHLACVLLVWMGLYSLLFILGSYFAPESRNSLRNLNTCPKTTGNKTYSHIINKDNLCTHPTLLWDVWDQQNSS